MLRASGCAVPEYMLQMPKASKNLKRKLAKAPVKRKAVGGGGRDLIKEAGKKKKQMIEASKRRKEAAKEGKKGGKEGKAEKMDESD